MRTRDLYAVVLVAGRGERLRPFTAALPKCLVHVGGQRILGRTLEILKREGIRRIILVTGYRSAKIQQFVRQEFPTMLAAFMHNPFYYRTNTLYSLWLSRAVVRGKPFLLLDGDLVFAPQVIERLLSVTSGNCLACDGSRRIDSEAVCVVGTRQGQVQFIGKRITARGTSLGESIGMAIFDGKSSRRLFDIATRLLGKRGSKGLYYEAAFQQLINGGAGIQGLDIRGKKWAEIDTKTDLRRARALFRD
ncbi:MAG: phosphocholine cytidylyltransferase family protein [Candidatus Acidiferrales bacterium]